MKILHISTRLILGGSQENTILSCEGQARAGHEVHLAFGPIYGPEGSMLERAQSFNTESGRKITTHEVPDMVRQLSLLRDARCYRQLRALIEAIRPDVVHTHSSKAGIIGRLAAWNVREAASRSSKPRPAVVHTIHGPPFMPVEGSMLQRAKLRLANFIYTLAERTAARRCHAIVSVADAMTEQFLARGIGHRALYTTVRSGIELAPYLDEAAINASDAARTNLCEHLAQLGTARPFIIGTVARLAQHKGHDDLLSAVALLMATDPALASRICLLWVGDGWWRDRLISRARAIGMRVITNDSRPTQPPAPPHTELTKGPILLLTGMVPPDEVPRQIRMMDVLCHPSYREGLPRTVPQALLCRVLPIAYDVDGTREACIDGQTGRLLAPGDVAALAQALQWAAANPDAARITAENGHQRCIKLWSTQAMLTGLDAVYAEAIARASR